MLGADFTGVVVGVCSLPLVESESESESLVELSLELELEFIPVVDKGERLFLSS